MNTNLGWLYYREYYRDYHNYFFQEELNIEKFNFQPENKFIQAASGIVPLPEIDERNCCFFAKTTYPGAFIGIGYSHETGGDPEFKNGFYFDYNSGLPTLPGSSVKGLLRSVFPFHRKNLGHDFQASRLTYIQDLLQSILERDVTKDQIRKLELELFEGITEESSQSIRLSHYQRDSFDEALLVSKPIGSPFLIPDVITPHEHPLGNPTPLQMIKIAPEVIIQFRFRLFDSHVIPDLKVEGKMKLFQEIMLEWGIGAKTNVGYGQLLPVAKREVDAHRQSELELGSVNEKEKAMKALQDEYTQAKRQRAKPWRDIINNQGKEEAGDWASEVDEIERSLAYDPGKSNEYKGEIIKEIAGYWGFEVNGLRLVKKKTRVDQKIEEFKNKRIKKSKSVGYDPPALGVVMKVRINPPNDDGFNFTAIPIWK